MSRKLLSILIAVLLAVGFVACGDDDEKNNTPNPFAEIGMVVSASGSTNINFAKIDAVGGALALEDDEFALIIDYSDSLYKPSQWTLHKPVLAGAYSIYTNKAVGAGIPDWDSNKVASFSNARLVPSATADVYYVILKGLNAGTTTISVKYGMLLDTDAGYTEYTGDAFWSAVFGGMDNIDIDILNTADVNTVADIEFKGAAVPAAKIAANGKYVGMIANSALIEPGIQTAGLTSVLKAGSRVRILWSDMPAEGEVPFKTAAWDTYPQGARVTGDAGWLSVSNETWTPATGGVVTVDLAGTRAVYTATLAADAPLGVQFKLVNEAGWDNGEELNNHAVTLPGAAAAADFTVKVVADFALAP